MMPGDEPSHSDDARGIRSDGYAKANVSTERPGSAQTAAQRPTERRPRQLAGGSWAGRGAPEQRGVRAVCSGTFRRNTVAVPIVRRPPCRTGPSARGAEKFDRDRTEAPVPTSDRHVPAAPADSRVAVRLTRNDTAVARKHRARLPFKRSKTPGMIRQLIPCPPRYGFPGCGFLAWLSAVSLIGSVRATPGREKRGGVTSRHLINVRNATREDRSPSQQTYVRRTLEDLNGQDLILWLNPGEQR
ncbi:hypothetical protein SKAU_G00177750 [Synaphobranchus kaupii]|uniref:Uncharacterized protein n=1 Tax=Synaphobranchus kaupii TaxID=118154 RepID=A0A9Q1FM86_SYNKA|nr:hypothetical protein SKAU_G00177750 [Synaphobranchus kaupii]